MCLRSSRSEWAVYPAALVWHSSAMERSVLQYSLSLYWEMSGPTVDGHVHEEPRTVGRLKRAREDLG